MTSPSGHQWLCSSNGGALPSVISGRLSRSGTVGGGSNGYAWINLVATPTRIGGYFSFDGVSSGVALLCAALPSYNTVGTPLVHAYVLADGRWYLQTCANANPWPDDLVTLASGTVAVATDGTPMPFYLDFSGMTCTITLPDGTTQAVTDASLGTSPGRYACWEILTATGNPSRWDDTSATKGVLARAAA